MWNISKQGRTPLATLARRFIAARKGNIGLMTALMIAPMMGAAGAAIDYSLAVKAQGKLEQAAQIAATNAATGMRRVINSYTTPTTPANSDKDQEAAGEGKRVGAASFRAQAAALANVTASVDETSINMQRVGNTVTATVNYSAAIQTTVMRVFGVPTITWSGKGAMIVSLLDEPGGNPNGVGDDVIINETWKSGVVAAGAPADQPVVNNWYSGTPGGVLNPLLSEPDSILDSNVRGAIRVGHPEGRIAPILSKKVYLPVGDYELRYWYRSTLIYPDYEPIYVCGTVESEMNWVISGRTREIGSIPGTTTLDNIANAQTARAGVYLRPILTNPQLATVAPPVTQFSAPPSLSTNVSTVRADPNQNRLDICAYSGKWIERTLRLAVTTSGYFWLSFVAEKPSSTTTLNGFYLGPVKLCSGTCRGTRNNNTPWRPYNISTQAPGSMLFRDSFDTPTRTDGTPFYLRSGTVPTESGYERPINYWMVLSRNTNGMVANGATQLTTTDFVYGTTGAGRSTAVDGNQYVRAMAPNRQLVRRMLLLPGYYRVKTYSGNRVRGDDCEPVVTDSATLIDFGRQDWPSTSSNPTLAPPGTTDVSSGSAIEPMGCGLMLAKFPTVVCYLVTGTQFYDFAFGVQTNGTTYVDANGATWEQRQVHDALTIEFMSSDIAAGFPDPQNACSSKKSHGGVETTDIWTHTVTGGPVWPGYTVRQLNRINLTAPLP